MRALITLLYCCSGIACVLATGSIFRAMSEAAGDPGMAPLVISLTLLFVAVPILVVGVLCAGVGGLLHLRIATKNRSTLKVTALSAG